MKKRFSDKQIIGFLMEAEDGGWSRNYAGNTILETPRFSRGVPNLAAWTSRKPGAKPWRQ